MAAENTPRIVFDPTLRLGKPVIAGTQVLVEEIIAKLATGLTVETLAETYQVTVADIQAALSYAAKKLATDEVETLLEESVQAGKYQQFSSLVEAIDWSTRRPEELTKAIDLVVIHWLRFVWYLGLQPGSALAFCFLLTHQYKEPLMKPAVSPAPYET